MGQANGNSSKANELLNKANRIIGTKTLYLILFIVIVAIVGIVSKNIYFTNIDEYKDNIYLKVNSSISEKFDVMFHEKINTSILVSSSLSKNINIKKAFLTNNSSNLNMDQLLDEMKTSKEYVDIQAELIDSDGISFKRSWTHHSGDDLVENDPDMAHLVKYPRVFTDVKATKYGLTITNKIPIYENDEFLGLFGVNIHFDALVDIFTKEGFGSVVLLNKDDSKKIVQDISYSKKFVGDCYVVNSNADDYLVKIIKTNQFEYCDQPWEKEFMINEATDHMVSSYAIKNTLGQEIAKAIIFKPIEQIDFEDLEFLKKAHIIATILFIVLLAFFISYLYMFRNIKDLKIENEQLLHVNNDLQTKTDEMDFNDKKLDNLFNMQPNLMVMHNGRELTKVNKRFMGFFNRFGTFDGFKKKHKCVSELFEKYEAPNYIWDQHLEGEFWIDYLLNNPRRLYKTVMSINGDPHHFIIKFNELEYAQHVTERVIIIALVDMTQDLVNYKTLDESAKVLDMLGNKLELKEEKGNTDISFELQEQLAKTISKLTKKEVVEKEIIRTNNQGLKGQNIIQVQGTLKFTDVESDWMFFIPTATASKILNTMMGNPNEKIEGNVTKDNIDTSREFISIVSTALCNEINEKEFHDLKDARYTESTIHELHRKDMEQLENIYKIKIKLEDNFEVEFFTNFFDDLIPFLQQMANEEEIKVPEKKEKPVIEVKEEIEAEKTKEEIVKESEEKSEQDKIDELMANLNKKPEKEEIKEKTEQDKIDDLISGLNKKDTKEKPKEKSEQDKIDELISGLNKPKEQKPLPKKEIKKEKTEQDKIDEMVASLNKPVEKKEDKKEIDEGKKIPQEEIETKIKEHHDKINKIDDTREPEETKVEIQEPAQETVIQEKEVKVKKRIEKKRHVQVTPKTVKRVQKNIVKEETPKQNKLDANSLIQNNFSETLKSLIEDDISTEKFSPVNKGELEGKNFIQTDNKFIIKGQAKELKWSMLMPAQSLSKIFNLKLSDKEGKILNRIDDDLENLAKEILNSIGKNVILSTANKVEFSSSDINIVENMKFNKDVKLYNIGIRINGEDLSIYMFI